MTRNVFALIFLFALLGRTAQQLPPVPPVPGQDLDARLPNGKSQREEILKHDHKKNLEDAAAMAKLAEEVSEDLEKDDRFVYSIKNVKKLEDIEKLSKAIRGRLKKY